MEVLEFLTAISPIILTIVATYVVVMQYRLEKKKFKLEHFDNRYKIYKTVMNYISDMVGNADTTAEAMLRFKRETNDVEIFFKEDIQDYVEEIYNKANDLRLCSKLLGQATLEQSKRTELAEEEAQILKWLGDQFTKCEEMFIKYLKISV